MVTAGDCMEPWAGELSMTRALVRSAALQGRWGSAVILGTSALVWGAGLWGSAQKDGTAGHSSR